MPPRASVVIPTFRRPEATLRAVRSVLAQTERELEVIVVDDASGDRTPDVIEALGDDRVTVLRMKENLGGGAARNRGIQAARAPLIALLDSDDELLPDSVRRRAEYLEDHPQDPFVYSRVIYKLSAKVELVAPTEPPSSSERFLNSLVVGQGLATSALMARAEALRGCPFDPSLAGVDDWDVALRLARLGPVGFVDESLSIVHAEDETEGVRVTFDFDPEAELRLLDLHRELFDRNPAAQAVVLYKVAMRAIRCRRAPQAAQYLKRVRDLDPGHRKARTMARLVGFGLAPLLPALLRLRWKLMLAMGRVR